MAVGEAPSALNMESHSGIPGTRILNPFRSSGVLIGLATQLARRIDLEIDAPAGVLANRVGRFLDAHRSGVVGGKRGAVLELEFGSLCEYVAHGCGHRQRRSSER